MLLFFLFLTHSLCNHVQELLTTTFDLENMTLSTRAFNLLSTPNEQVIHALLENNVLSQEAEKIFQQENSNLILINRLAAITQACCIDTESASKCTFIPNFLNFCMYRSVYEMFKTFLTSEDKKDVQAFLLQEGFAGKVLEQIQKIPETLPTSQDDPSVQNLINLFRIIPFFKDSSEGLSASIATPEAVTILSRAFQPNETSVLNYQWAALASIVNASTFQAIEGLSDRFFGIIDNQTYPYFTSYVESIIKIMSQLMTLDKDFAQKLIDWECGKKLGQLILNYPKHTLGHLAITNFALKTLEITDVPQLASSVLIPLFEIVQTSFQDEQPAEFRAFGFNLQKTVNDKIKENNLAVELPALNQETQDKIQNLTKIVTEPYGGDLPVQNTEETDELGNLTPEQLMILLRFITGGRH